MIKRVLAFENPATLSMNLQQLVVKKDDKVTTIPIEDIGVVVLDNKQIVVTHALLSTLAKNNVAVVVCDDTHLPIGLQLPLDGNHIQTERFQEQISASEPLRKQMWQQTVQWKIRNQASVLALQGQENRNMKKWVLDVKSGDSDNLEARAAAYYWKTIFPSLPNFVRDTNEQGINSLLNYGYAIVRAMMARALVAAGLLPTLGIHHHNRYNAYCLADDIMEPYRPYVDKEVISIMQVDEQISELTNIHKQRLLLLPFVDVNIDGHRSPMMVAIQTTANSVQRCYSGDSRKIIYPEL